MARTGGEKEVRPDGDGGPEAGHGDVQPGEESPAPGKRTLSAFAAALERKKAAGQAHGDHKDGGAKVGGATSNRKTSRTFRRKSG